MFQVDQIPFFKHLQSSKRILLAGAGGGFDIFTGIPIYFALTALGKEVTLANLSFTDLSRTNSELLFNACYKVHANDRLIDGGDYFPEKVLCQWFAHQGIPLSVYAFRKTGVRPLRDAYKQIARIHGIDTVVLMDGGTDSLMFGDEESLGTPHEDICSMAAAFRSGITHQFLLSIGFGIDHFHGVSHYRFLENVALLAKEGGYLGMWQLMKEMSEAKQFISAVEFANEKVASRPSIVCNSILSALLGNYGDVHFSGRTAGSHLWINPLMTAFWAFDLRKVIDRIEYYPLIKDTNSMGELSGILQEYRSNLKTKRKHKRLPI